MCANLHICFARSYIIDHDTLLRLQAFTCVYKPLNMFLKGTGARVGYFLKVYQINQINLLCANKFEELIANNFYLLQKKLHINLNMLIEITPHNYISSLVDFLQCASLIWMPGKSAVIYFPTHSFCFKTGQASDFSIQ